MTMLAETVDAVIGIDTHRDSHEVEIADRAGKPIAVMRIGNDSAGFTQLLAAIAKVVPGPRVAVYIERPADREPSAAPAVSHARYRKPWHTKIIYRGGTPLTALFAESV